MKIKKRSITGQDGFDCFDSSESRNIQVSSIHSVQVLKLP